jgi:arylsulfatase A-like enzyme
LAEILAAEGFRTAAVVTNPWLRASYGFDRGFETYLSLPEETARDVNAKGAAVNQAAEAMLDEFGSERFFLYLHYMDVHNPYLPQEPYKSTFVGKRRGRKWYKNGPAPRMSQRDVRFNEAHYDGAIREFDDQIRELHEALRARGLEENTLFVFVSDHGDEFHEHGGLGHGWTLYEELIRIVLFFSHPVLASSAQRIDEPVSGVDVLPTLLELMGVERPKDLDGISLAPWVLGRASASAPPRRILLSELATIKAARRGSKKLIWTEEAGGGESEAFDLSRDPMESRPLDKDSKWVADLGKALETLQPGAAADQTEVFEVEDSEAERRLQEQLEWLGYVDESSEDSGGSPPVPPSSKRDREENDDL